MKKLYKHQERILNQAPNKTALFWSCGIGKTFAAIELGKLKKEKAIIVVPKSIKEQWQAEDILDWLVITKETFRRDWDTLKKFETLIVDESHFFSHHKSKMSQSLAHYIKKHDPKHIYLLTATPYTTEPLQIWTLAWYLGYKWDKW